MAPDASSFSSHGLEVPRPDGWQFVAPDEQRFMQTGHEFEVGDVVKFDRGPLSDLPLDVVEIHGRTARVFSEMFGARRGFDADVANLVQME